MRLDQQPWWTEADQAELELLLWEVIRVGGNDEAIKALLEWREGRILLSKAQWLRVRQRAREELAA